MLINPLYLLISSAAVFPVIFHLMRKFGKKEILFPAACLIKDSGVPLKKKFRLRELIQLILRILVIFCTAAAFSRPATKIKFPFSRTISQVAVVADISESVTRSGIYEKEFSGLLDYVSGVCVTGKGQTDFIDEDAFDRSVFCPREIDGSADIPFSLLLCREMGCGEPLLITDRQKISWRGMESLCEDFDAVTFPDSQYVFAVKSVILPEWFLSDDTAYIFLSTNPGFYAGVHSQKTDTVVEAEDGIFLPLFVSSSSDTVLISSTADSLFVILHSKNQIKIFSNNEEIFRRIFSVFPEGKAVKTFFPESASIAFIDESEFLDFTLPGSGEVKVFVFLDDASKLGNYVEVLTGVSSSPLPDKPAVIRQGLTGFLGTTVLYKVLLTPPKDLANSHSVINRFEDGNPALIKCGNNFVFAFSPENSTIFSLKNFPVLLLNLALGSGESHSISPFVPDEERASDYLNDDFASSKSCSLDEMTSLVKKSALFDMSPFLTYILIFLLLAEGFYSFYLGKRN
ncbi:BatA domain-containing protein [candidate division WOR-3 bacterium]|nr:BatA domain-containing protein [candidate division WOR-3 bacterium]